MEKHYAIIRIASRCSRTAIGQANAHGNRSDVSAHVDRTRSHLNQFWVPSLGLEDPKNLVAAVDRVTEVLGARRRSDNAGLLAEFHVGATPEFFLYDDGRDGFDPDKIQRWTDHNIQVFKRKFPGQVAQVRLDMDEKTPHLAVFVVPTYVKTTKRGEALWVSYRKVFGGKKIEASEKCIALQDWYAAEMACFGLHRGEPKEVTGAVHTHHNTYRQIEAKKSAETQLAKEKAEAEAASAERASLAALLFVLQLQSGLDALNKEKSDLEQKLQQLKAEQSALDQQKIAHETTFQKMVAGLSRAVELIANGQITRHIKPDRSSTYRVNGSEQDQAALTPIWKMVQPMLKSAQSLLEKLDAERKAAQSERERLAAERERIKLENAAMATEFEALTAETSVQLNAFKDAVSDLMGLRHEMTTEQLQRLNAAVGDDGLTPF
ncbi:plasmid recombination protein [Devosia sp. Root635]|uniref:plasmid recombination protein n=1 Tax=Devosia sp. Root635 TaxID=1736575 RepID=UPI0006F38ECA|nr:plasmid recombination protein [Devosia sp. Root635]KRA42039.1 hypothetical protein ASD80_09950 [Devosia sp. Root635]